jgi:hypothetical protein
MSLISLTGSTFVSFYPPTRIPLNESGGRLMPHSGRQSRQIPLPRFPNGGAPVRLCLLEPTGGLSRIPSIPTDGLMDSAQHNSLVNFIWGVADDVLRDVYVRGKYRDVILPMTVIRRLDALLEPTKLAVLARKKLLDSSGITNQDGALKQFGRAFYNVSPFSLADLRSPAAGNSLSKTAPATLLPTDHESNSVASTGLAVARISRISSSTFSSRTSRAWLRSSRSRTKEASSC